MALSTKKSSSFEKQLQLRFGYLIALQVLSLSLLCLLSEWTVPQSLAIAAPILAITLWQCRSTANKVRSVLNVLVNSLEHINSNCFSSAPYFPYKKGVLHSLSLEYEKLQQQLQKTNFSNRKDAYVMYQLIEQLETPILLFDHRGLLVNANPTSKLFLGKDWRLVKGGSLSSFGLSLEEDGQIQCAGEHNIWSVKSCISTAGDNKFYLVLLQNIESELRAKELSSWHKLIKVIGHEVRNSLTPIYSLSHALAESLKSDESKHQALSVIANRSKSLQEFIGRTTELASLSHVNIEPINIKKKIEDCCSLIPELDYELSVTVDKLEADPVQLERVLLNLIKNAFESMTTKRAIRISVFEANGGVELAIEDKGCGIYETNNLFVPFYTTKEHGSGIGLPLCKQIVDAHKGKIQITNNENSPGVTASVWLPKIA